MANLRISRWMMLSFMLFHAVVGLQFLGDAVGADLSLRNEPSNRTVCGSETGDSGLKTDYYCEGDKPVCCRDSTTTLDEGIPWACIPAEGVCCGQGDYCGRDLFCVRDGNKFSCRGAGRGASLDLPSLVGSTPQLDNDHSNVKGTVDQPDSAPALGAQVWWSIMALCAAVVLL